MPPSNQPTIDREETELAAQVPKAFAVVDDASANWVVRRILDARAYALKVANWADAEQPRARRDEAFFLKRFGPELEAWLTQELAARKSRQKSINLPAGRVGRRTVREKLIFEDEYETMKWAKRHLPEAIKYSESLRKSTINDLFFGTGELPPGVEVQPAHESLVIH